MRGFSGRRAIRGDRDPLPFAQKEHLSSLSKALLVLFGFALASQMYVVDKCTAKICNSNAGGDVGNSM